MPIIQLFVLAAVQGITEFLPVSSSAHLILVPELTGWADQGLAMDVAVHVGTLLAVIFYFWRDVGGMLIALGRTVRVLAGRRALDPEFWLIVKLFVATIPVVIAGFVLDRYFPNLFRSVEVIAWATIGFAVLLYFADKMYLTIRRIEHISIAGALMIGLFQVLALIPGTSRSGITMTAARFLGVERPDAARFSLLLSIPTIAGAGALKGWDVYRAGDLVLLHDSLIAGGLAFLCALIAIAVMMAWLRRATFTPFVLYRIALGGLLLAMVYGAPFAF